MTDTEMSDGRIGIGCMNLQTYVCPKHGAQHGALTIQFFDNEAVEVKDCEQHIYCMRCFVEHLDGAGVAKMEQVK